MPPPKKRALKAVRSGAAVEETVAPLPPGSAIPSYVEGPRSRQVERRWEKARAEGRIEITRWHEWIKVGDNEWDYTGKTELRERVVPPEDRRCTAVMKRGQWVDSRCTQYSNKGVPVCERHGGRLPEVKKAAQRRLGMAADAAAAKLLHIALYKRGVADKDRIKALVEVLNRAGVEGRTTVEIEVKPWQEVLATIDNAVPGQATLQLTEGEDYTVESEVDELEDDEDD